MILGPRRRGKRAPPCGRTNAIGELRTRTGLGLWGFRLCLSLCPDGSVNRSAGTNPGVYQGVPERSSRRSSGLPILGLKSRFNASTATAHYINVVFFFFVSIELLF